LRKNGNNIIYYPLNVPVSVAPYTYNPKKK
jgi:hypothetical protein